MSRVNKSWKLLVLVALVSSLFFCSEIFAHNCVKGAVKSEKKEQIKTIKADQKCERKDLKEAQKEEMKAVKENQKCEQKKDN